MASHSAPDDVPALACPGLFYATHAADGVLSRIRTPGGLVSAEQCGLVAEISERFAGGTVTITNRANVQLRALEDRLPADVLDRLQRAGLASDAPAVDHLRNIMASPTAGLDASAIIDTRRLVRALDRHIVGHPELAALPAKFSIGLDGGERASIAQLPNDILFRAYRDDTNEARFRVVARIGQDEGEPVDIGLVLTEDQVVPAVAAIAELYLSLLPADGSKPRLRHLLANLGRKAFRQALLASRYVDSDDVFSVIPTEARNERSGGISPVDSPAEIPRLHSQARSARDDRGELAGSQPQHGIGLDRVPGPVIGGEALPTQRYAIGAPIGAHAQRGVDLVYVGLAPFVAGRLSSSHLRHLADLAERYGSGSLRLTPWRNVLVPDLPSESVEVVQAEIERVGLSCRAASLAAGIVACAGSAGCGAGFVDTVRDAQALSARLDGMASTRSPVNIHLSGCEKRCAQRRQADLTLLGRPGDGERYDLYIGGSDAPVGRLFMENLTPSEALKTVEDLVAGFEEERRGASVNTRTP